MTRHCTYCTNIHPGESLADVRAALRDGVLPVKRAVSPDAPFGVGLRLSARATFELHRPGELEALRGWLDDAGLYVFTVNGFPYGDFHETRVKQNVYRPDWLDDARLAYSDRLAEALCALLPDGVDGSVSTVPGAFLARSSADEAQMARRLIAHAATLHALRERTGKTVTLALEPEPCCHLETTAQAVAFFERWLFSAAAVDTMARLTQATAAESERALRRHLGLCLDACHLAVEFEAPREALERLRGAGVRIAKLQVSAGLEASPCEELRAFADDVYLHQVIEQAGDGALVRWVDLPDALASRGTDADRRWRVHFHVPIFLERLGRFGTTQRELKALLADAVATAATEQLEVETYSFGLLPEEHRLGSVTESITRELQWLMKEIR